MIRTNSRVWLAALIVGGLVAAGAGAAGSQPGRPETFRLGPQGDITCLGTTEDACAFYDEIPLPSGAPLFLVQGSYSHKTNPAATQYTNVYFAVLCRREGDLLTPFFDFLEGRERASDVHLHDLTGDGVPEIVVTAAFDSRGSYGSVYRVETGEAVRIFHHRANTASTDFELDHHTPSLVFEQLDSPKDRVRREVYAWNGQAFVLES